jgi:hypothetical protein
MKRSTLILLFIAAGLGAFVYFYELRDGKGRDEKTETSQPAFTFKREDLAAITVTRAGQTITLEQRDNQWVITQPVNTAADQTAVDALISGLTDARIERNLTASAEEIKSYGLSEPAVTLEIKLKNGEMRRLKLGAKDFSGLSVYGQLDQAPDAVLLPASLLTSADKPLDDLRDRAVLGVSQYDLSALKLSNEHGQLTLAKQDANWMLKSPIEAAADESEVSSLLGEITSAKAVEFVSETADDPAKYGLHKPAITLTAQLPGGAERVLTIGSKTEEHYFAKNSERPAVFKIPAALYDKLNAKPASLRDKQIIKLDKDELTRIEIKNLHLTLVAEKDNENKWLIKSPAEQKDKEAQSWKLFDPLETNKATEVLDPAPAAIAAKLAKPAVEVKLTDKSGKITTLRVSAADGDNAYVSVAGKPGVYKVSKQMVEGLSFKAADITL